MPNITRGHSRTPIIDAAIDRAVTMPSSTIRSHVDSLRRRNPEANPARIIELLSKEYTMVLQGAGGAVGAAAAVPGVGTGVSLALSSGDVATFFASSSAYALAVAEVHGIQVEDIERRRALLLATVLGETGAQTVADASGKPAAAWGTALLTTMPQSTIKQVNRVLAKRFIKRQVVKQGSLMMGRIIPFGIGAAIGIAGGRTLARTVVNQAIDAFGPPPETFARPVVIDGSKRRAAIER